MVFVTISVSRTAEVKKAKDERTHERFPQYSCFFTRTILVAKSRFFFGAFEQSYPAFLLLKTRKKFVFIWRESFLFYRPTMRQRNYSNATCRRQTKNHTVHYTNAQYYCIALYTPTYLFFFFRHRI